MASAVEITLSEEERGERERRAAKLTLPYRDVQRAKVVLYAADGLSNVEIAGRLEMCSQVVGQWRRRFGEQQPGGSGGSTAVGSPAALSPRTRSRRSRRSRASCPRRTASRC